MTHVLPDEIDRHFLALARPEVAGIELAGEAVLLDEAGELHLLNSTATIVWHCCDGSASLAEIAAELAISFVAGQNEIERDVIETARQFGRKGLLEGVQAEDP